MVSGCLGAEPDRHLPPWFFAFFVSLFSKHIIDVMAVFEQVSMKSYLFFPSTCSRFYYRLLSITRFILAQTVLSRLLGFGPTKGTTLPVHFPLSRPDQHSH